MVTKVNVGLKKMAAHIVVVSIRETVQWQHRESFVAVRVAQKRAWLS